MLHCYLQSVNLSKPQLSSYSNKMTIKRTIFYLLFCFPIPLLGQQNDTIAITVRVKIDSLYYPLNSPVFIIDLKNISNRTVKVPKETVLDTCEHMWLSYIHTVLEEVNDNEGCSENVWRFQRCSTYAL